jgi:hypothetical protein
LSNSNAFLGWAHTHRNPLIVAGLVCICLGIDVVALRSVQDYALTGGFSFLGLFLIIFIPFTIAVPALWYLIVVRKMRQELVFLIAATVFGLLLMLVRTPYTWFDENDHAYLAIYYSDVALGAEHGVNEDGQLTWTGRAEDANNAALSPGAFSYHKTSVDDYRLMVEHFFTLEQNPGQTTTLAVDDTGVFYQYIPSALGVTIAHLLHWGKVPTLYLGKLFSLAFFVLMMYLTIKIAPQRFKTLMALLGLIPFILSSAGTFSYDTTINVLSFFLIAFVLRLAYESKRVRARDIVLLAIIGTLLAPLKFVYFPLVFLPLIIPGNKWPRPHFRIFWCLGMLILGLCSIGLFSLHQTTTTVAGATADTSLDSYYPDAYTLKSLFAHPTSALRVLGRSFFEHIGLIIDTNSGFTFSSRLPTWTSYLVFVLLVLNTGSNGNEGSAGRSSNAGNDSNAGSRADKALPTMRASTRLITLALASAIYVLVLLASVSWTTVGATLLMGIQGRYFIPLLPLLALAISGLIRPNKDLSYTSLYLFCCLNGMEVFFTFLSVI